MIGHTLAPQSWLWPSSSPARARTGVELFGGMHSLNEGEGISSAEVHFPTMVSPGPNTSPGEGLVHVAC